MVPMYAARVSDLGPGDFVRVECGACGHDMLIPASSLTTGLRLAKPSASPGARALGPDERITDLAARFRCRECDVRGRAVLSIRWADVPDGYRGSRK